MLHHVNDMYTETFKKVYQVQRAQGTAWAALTPFPFFYYLTTKMIGTVKKRSPDLIKSNAVWTWEILAGGMEVTMNTGKMVAVTSVRGVATACQVTRNYITAIDPPGPLRPIKLRLILPFFELVEESKCPELTRRLHSPSRLRSDFVATFQPSSSCSRMTLSSSMRLRKRKWSCCPLAKSSCYRL